MARSGRLFATLAIASFIAATMAAPGAHAAPPTGWAGEVLVGGTSDDWEPSIAADPSAPYAYVMYNRYGGAKACKNCPSPSMMVQVSSNGGQSWGPENFICTCSGVSGQWDPVLRVSATGVVYASWMNYSTIVFSKSTDHGATWSNPVAVSGKSWADKDWMGISDDGHDVYIAYESRSNFMVTNSHDSGATWSAPLKVNSDTGHYRYANGFEVLPSGTAVLSDSSYPNGSGKAAGAVDIEVWRSTNGGSSWSRVVVDGVSTGVDFDTSSTTTIASDAGGALVLEYSGATAVGSSGHVYARRSTDGGLTWSARSELTPAGGTGNASFPGLTGTGTGRFFAIWQEGRTGSWNTYERSSTDGGATWSSELRISDASGGASYKTAAGYGSAYGDYNAIDVTNLGKAIAAWGEGASFSAGPGGIWVNRQT